MRNQVENTSFGTQRKLNCVVRREEFKLNNRGNKNLIQNTKDKEKRFL